MYTNDISVELLINNKSAQEYKLSDGRTFIEGRKNSNYEIRIKNNTYARKKVVVSVDGLSIMNGEQASYKDTGYILNSQESITIPGWHLDSKEVASFKFGDKEHSYSEQTDNGTGNVGVIGVAVFNEKYDYNKMFNNLNTTNIHHFYHKPAYNPIQYATNPWDYSTLQPYLTGGVGIGTNSAMGSATLQASATASPTRGFETTTLNQVSAQNCISDMNMDEVQTSSFNLGTEFGKATEFKTSTVSFTAEENPNSVTQLFYTDRKGLEKLGVVFDKKYKVTPDPFPKSSGCKPPTGWNR